MGVVLLSVLKRCDAHSFFKGRNEMSITGKTKQIADIKDRSFAGG